MPDHLPPWLRAVLGAALLGAAFVWEYVVVPGTVWALPGGLVLGLTAGVSLRLALDEWRARP